MKRSELDEVDEELVARALALVPRILALADRIDEARQIPPDLADAMAAANLFMLFAPRSHGGEQAHPLTALRVVEELSKADGSVGWVAMNSSTISTVFGWLPQDVVRAMEGPDGRVRIAGSARSLGTATEVEGGYRVSGRWNFISGVTHSNWIFATCTAEDADAEVMTYIPVSEGKVIDTWHVLGMRGTASRDFEVRDVFVPRERAYRPGGGRDAVDDPLYRGRFVILWGWSLNAGVSLGIARAAIDEFCRLASQKSSAASADLLRDRPPVQAQIGQAEAIVSAARAYLVDALHTGWEAAQDRERDPLPAIVQLRLAIIHAVHEAVRAVDIVFHAAGTNAIFDGNRLERFFRDVHVSKQHAAALPVHYESAGKYLFGLDNHGWEEVAPDRIGLRYRP